MSPAVEFGLAILLILFSLPFIIVLGARAVYLWTDWLDWVMKRFWHDWRDRREGRYEDEDEEPVPDNVTPHPSAPRPVPDDQGEAR